MTTQLAGPFFEIGPKNLIRRAELEVLVLAAGRAGAECGVTVVVTVPTALIAPIAELGSGVRVFAQALDSDELGPSVGTVTAEALVDAGAEGVMLNHDSRPLDRSTLASTVKRAQVMGLQTIVCAGTQAEVTRCASLDPTVVLYEPPELIGTAGGSTREWIGPTNAAVRKSTPGILMMHAGGVGAPEIARSIMAAGADGTGSTSGILASADPLTAVRHFIAATRAGWEEAQSRSATTYLTHINGHPDSNHRPDHDHDKHNGEHR